MDKLIEVKDLQTYFFTADGIVRAVDGATFEVNRGKVLGIVGESGCGKSITVRSIMRMIRAPGRIVGGEVLYHRQIGPGQIETVNLLDLPPTGSEMRSIRGAEISMIFQEPRASLSPVHTIGEQITENILLHEDLSEAMARDKAIQMLRQVNLPMPEQRMGAYPHQLSGGMCQRVMIAMALACQPNLLIADEPTTALDVTTEAQILELMQALQAEMNMAIIFITHDLGVVAEMADQVAVMYLGKVVERGSVQKIFDDPKHPYTQALLESLPRLEQRQQWLKTIRGVVPDPHAILPGCPFHPRCSQFMAGLCDQIKPSLITLEDGHEVSCLLYGDNHQNEPSPIALEDVNHG